MDCDLGMRMFQRPSEARDPGGLSCDSLQPQPDWSGTETGCVGGAEVRRGRREQRAFLVHTSSCLYSSLSGGFL